MRFVVTVGEMQQIADGFRSSGKRVALVPTMGALHDGHLELIRRARALADVVVVSVFVNPTQFGPGEDFEKYPRVPESDREKLDSVAGGVDVVFAPASDDIYPEGSATWVEVADLTEQLCGYFRPGHFRGVTTIVAKLFLACKPHVAVFGLKDAQQFLVLKRMVKDLNFDVEMIGVPTVREPDGLAMSSRNMYLTEEERTQSVVLSRAVAAAAELVQQGETSAERIRNEMERIIGEAPSARLQYAEVVDQDRIQPVPELRPGQEVLAAVAVFFGKTRLIDNAFIRVPATVRSPQSHGGH